jgi:hypothetical protein
MLTRGRVTTMAALLFLIGACGGSAQRPPATPDVAMRIRFAECMRQQGISDFPDPDQQGRFQLPPSLAQGGNLKSSPRWPQVQEAMDGPCHRYDPSGHI